MAGDVAPSPQPSPPQNAQGKGSVDRGGEGAGSVLSALWGYAPGKSLTALPLGDAPTADPDRGGRAAHLSLLNRFSTCPLIGSSSSISVSRHWPASIRHLPLKRNGICPRFPCVGMWTVAFTRK